MKHMFESLNQRYIGLSIESRVFIIIGIVGIFFSLASSVMNLFLGVGVLPILSSLASGILTLVFVIRVYQTERYGLYAGIILVLLVVLVYPLRWIMSGGSQGVIPMFFVFNFIVIAIMMKRKWLVGMVVLHLGVLASLYTLEYRYPMVIRQYSSDFGRILDTGIFVGAICLGVFFIMYWIMAEYNGKIGNLDETRKQLNRLTLTDTLSGLWNRRHVMDVLEEEAKNKHPLALIMVDIDHFKKINDTYGHNVGDEVIVGVAQALTSKLRSSDLVGRIGGEEFLIVLKEDRADIVLRIAEKLRRFVETIAWAKIEGSVHISAGVYITEPEDSVYDMLDKADKAMYQAKKDGRNRVCLYQEETVLEGA